MDISAFSDDNFEVKEWINQTFRTAEAQENKEAFVSSMVMKLQLYVQQVNSALEDTSQQVLQGLPRVMRDTKMLHQEAMMLREKMQTIKHEIAQVEKETGNSMASLERIDRIKSELQMAKDALHEADNWTLLATDIEEVFETKNVEKIASKLVSMQQSLSILANSADYEDRKLQLEGLKNRLEAIASPQLVQAFTSGNIEQSRKFVTIFSGMERLPQLVKYHDRCHKGTLCQQWRNLVEVEQDQSIAEWMHTFYDSLLSNWHKQVKWCNNVFGQANSLIEVYVDVLLNLDPSINDCIDAALKQQTQQLAFLTELKQITKTFANNLHVAISAQCKRKESWENIAHAVYAPYIPYMTRYAALEEAHISSQLKDLVTNRDDLMDSVQGLGQSIPRAISITIDALKRCISFTEGCGFPGLVKALQVYFGSYLDQYSSILRQLEQKRSEHENWNLFQMCLTLLQTAGELLTELKKLDQEIVQNILECCRKQSVTRYITILLVPTAQQELRDLLSSVQDGSVTSVLESVILNVEKFCREVHYTTYKVIFHPVSVQLETASVSWSVSKPTTYTQDLPDYSFAPQEYITQIGEYLMTLPQHLEPFLLRENPSLTGALQVQASDGREGEGGFADLLLGMVARGTCQTYLDHILAISELSPVSSRQLATDINYLGNVLEDLGFELLDSLQQVSLLLKIAPEDYQSQSTGAPPKLVAAVRQMRNIT